MLYDIDNETEAVHVPAVVCFFPSHPQDARPLDRDDASDEDDGGPIAPNWEPASRDADPASGNRGGGDILSMLVSIYGSKVRTDVTIVGRDGVRVGAVTCFSFSLGCGLCLCCVEVVVVDDIGVGVGIGDGDCSRVGVGAI